MNDPRNVASLQFVRDLIYKHKVAPSPAQSQAFAQDIGPFATGKVAMIADGGWSIAGFQQLDFEWGIAPLPKFGSKRVAPYWLGGWVIPKSTKTQDAAFDFAQWSASDFQPRMAKDHDWIPLRNAERTSKAMRQGMPAGYGQSIEQLDEARVGDIYHVNNLQIVEEVFNPTFEQLWNDKITPAKAAATIDQKGGQLLTS